MSALVTQHLPLLAGAPDGIKKLRELILELAVNGRLLPVAQTNSKWQSLKLTDIATYRIGKTPPSKDAKYWGSVGIPWVSISDMEHFSTLDTTKKKVSRDFSSEIFRYPPVPAGSLLMSFKLTVGKVCVLAVDAYHNEAIISLQPKSGVSRDYLMRVLPSIALGGNTKNALMGSTLNSESLSELIVPLPPYDEQLLISQRIDELMVLCDRLEARQTDAESAHAQLVEALLGSLTQTRDANDFATNWQRLSQHFHTLFTTESSVDSLKQAVLQLAVMGKLVPQNPSEESAVSFAHRIRSEKQRHIKDSTVRKQKELEQESLPKLPYEVPAGWEWQRVDDVLHITGGVTLGRKLGNRDLVSKPYLRVANVQRGRLEMGQIKEVEVPDDEVEKYLLQNGDLLITEGGDWDKVGRTAIWRKELPECLHQNHVFRARAVVSEWEPRWAEMYLNSDSAKNYFAGSSKQTTNLASINMTQLRSCAFPLPPLAEQRRIVAKVDQLMALCDQLKSRLTQARQLNQQLASTLVQHAVA